MTFGCYNNYSLLNTGMYGFNSLGNNCCLSPNYFSGQMIGALLGGGLTIGAGVTSILVTNHKAKSAAQTKANTDAEKAVSDALAKMPEGYRSEALYETKPETMTGISDISAYKTQKDAVIKLENEVKTLSTPDDTTDKATIANYETAKSELSTLESNYKDLCSNRDGAIGNRKDELQKEVDKAFTELNKKRNEVGQLEREKKTAEANIAKRKELADAQAELKKLEPAYTKKVNEIKDLQGKVTEAITKRNELKTQNASNKEAAVFDKGDGNIATRNNIFAPKTSKARTACSEFYSELTKFRATGSTDNAAKAKVISKYKAFKSYYDALNNPSSSLSDAMTMATEIINGELK